MNKYMQTPSRLRGQVLRRMFSAVAESFRTTGAPLFAVMFFIAAMVTAGNITLAPTIGGAMIFAAFAATYIVLALALWRWWSST